MSDQSQLLKRAARLFALALKAREEGHLDYAERLTKRASGILEQPTALERLGTQKSQRILERPTQTMRSVHGRRPISSRAGWERAGQLSGRSAHCAIALFIEDELPHWGSALACACAEPCPLHCSKNSQLRGASGQQATSPSTRGIRRHREPLSLQPLGLSSPGFAVAFSQAHQLR